MQDYTKLHVWHLARELALAVIEALPQRTSARVPGLRNQCIRSATSISANIAEGCSRRTRRDFINFLRIALGSLNELQGHLLLARDSSMIQSDT